MLKKTILLLVATIFLVYPCVSWGLTASETGSYLDRKSEGWFWYQDPKDLIPEEPVIIPPPTPKKKPEQEKKVKKKPVSPPSTTKPADEPFTVKWIKKNLPILRDRAIDNPTDKNVAAYMYAQRVMMDKSQNFARKVKEVVMSDPFLDESNRIPLASAMRAAVFRAQGKAQEEAMKYLSTTTGIWFFFDSKCKFCFEQWKMVKHLAKKYDLAVLNISKDGKPLPEMKEYRTDIGQSKLLDLQIIPAVVLVRPPDKAFVISQGLTSSDGLEDRVFMAARIHELLPEDMVRRADIFQRGVLSPADMKDLPNSEDPGEMINTIRERLKKTYW